MSKKSIQSRKFLEEQVKLMLNEYASGTPSSWFRSLSDVEKAVVETAIGILEGGYEQFVAIGNQIINKLYGGNFEQAFGSLNYDKKPGMEKNLEDLKTVKDFFILFSEPNLADQELGSAGMGDYLDP